MHLWATDESGKRGATFAGAAILVVAVTVAYSNGLTTPFLADDVPTILDNPSIRNLADFGAILAPPPHAFSAGRPVLNLSFALCYAVGGTGVTAYHVGNIAIHLLSALALWGIVGRTFAALRFRARFGIAPATAALCAALIWAVHPSHAAAVTYVSQRAESCGQSR